LGVKKRAGGLSLGISRSYILLMTDKTFFNSLSNSTVDIVQTLLGLLQENEIDYCVIGGLAVNAYVEPVVSLDLDMVVASDRIERIKELSQDHFRIEEFPYSINLYAGESDLRIQIQTDPRYQDFVKRAKAKNVLGYSMKVATLEDVLKGKIWAYSDLARRKSKRQKDLADIMRLIECYPDLQSQLPDSIKATIQE
jgi:hypothetical protein